MDMKKILQAVDGISAQPVKGADSMARFLRVVKEAEINQPQGLPAVTPIKVPPIPQLPAQDGELGGGRTVTTNADGTRTYSSGIGMFTYDAQGKAITYASPQMMGLGQSINLANNQTTQTYNAGPLATSQRVDANGKPLQTKINYNIGTAKMGYDNDHVSGIRSAEFTPHPDMPPELFKPKDMYARGNKDREATYDRAMAQVNGTPANEDYNSMKRFLNVVSETTLSRQVYLGGYNTSYLQQIVISNQAKNGITPQQALAELKSRIGNLDPHSGEPPSPDFVKKYLSKRLEEGASPHKVALPVQMAMQHYQQVKETPPRERLIDRYFVEAETEITQRREEKRALINQYAKTIAERVLMKESAQSVSEAPIAMDPAEPNNPTIHNHQKANTMSLKDRIASARAQLQELAELSESNSLLAWEQICKKAKGGMFMGLEQNLEQIRHGIEELAKQRRKGGTASRGIDKHIGEGKTK